MSNDQSDEQVLDDKGGLETSSASLLPRGYDSNTLRARLQLGKWLR